MSLTIVFDGQWGSCGKGKVCSYLARVERPKVVSSCNMPNAGHTVVDETGKHVFKVLPSASGQPGVETILLGPATGYSPKRLTYEVAKIDRSVIMHGRAFIVTQDHAALEESTMRNASTKQGSGAALCDKIMRRDVLANLSPGVTIIDPMEWVYHTQNWLKLGWLHEVAQGFALSIDHGSHYPHCTSRNCGPVDALAQLGLPAKTPHTTYMVLRPYPIRVGSDGEHSSGGWYDDQTELTWENVAERSGCPLEPMLETEITTVTKRQRRVATFSNAGVGHAIKCTQPDAVILNFAQYIDSGATGVRIRAGLPQKVLEWIRDFEDRHGVPIRYVGTGAHVDDMVAL